jgi:hypothetical protein
MSDMELRGIVLQALYNQRRKNLVKFDKELKKLPVPDGAMESILRQLEENRLIERTFQPLVGLGNGRITGYGIKVVEGTTISPLSIVFQPITVQGSSNVQIGTGNVQNASDVEKLNIAIDHSQASKDAPESIFERISKLVIGVLKKFGLNV